MSGPSGPEGTHDKERSGALREATLTGVRWLVLMRGASEVINFTAAVVLARLLSPGDFGRAAVALIFVMLGVMLTFEGFASALVQRSEVSEQDRRVAMLMSIIGGAALSFLVYALTGPVWRPLFGPGVAQLIALISPTMLIAALGGVSRATAWRNLDFRRVSVIDMLSSLAGSLASVACAVAGLGARSLAIGGLVQTIATSAMSDRGGAAAEARLVAVLAARDQRIRDPGGVRGAGRHAVSQHRLRDPRGSARSRPGGLLLPSVQHRCRVPDEAQSDHDPDRVPGVLTRR